MLNSEVLLKVDSLRVEFDTARPFRHLVIDHFLEESFAESLLRDFPSFDSDRAKNEFGLRGKKFARSDLENVSDFYRIFYRWIQSREFVSTVESLSGIPDLIPDPNLFGGGTHENLEGQWLDAHVDFNFDPASGLHRRLNLLIYLNKEWEFDWGGCIELHSNPRNPDLNSKAAFLPLFNRLVMFETNEYSWHGFEEIQLPANKKHFSRKAIALYLYSRTRPESETAPEHSTFYVQAPLPSKFASGYQLNQEDVGRLRRLVSSRDSWIEHYQKSELDWSRKYGQLLKSQTVETIGYVRHVAPTEGRFIDGWIGKSVRMHFEALREIAEIEMKVYRPEGYPEATVQVEIDGKISHIFKIKNGETTQRVSCEISEGSSFTLAVTSRDTFNQRHLGIGNDSRDLLLVLSRITFFDR